MSIINIFEEEDCCPDIDELVNFVFGIEESPFIENHIKQCELCEDLAGGIDAFRKENKELTKDLFFQKLNAMDESFLQSLKSIEDLEDPADGIIQKSEHPDDIERRILKILYPLAEEPFCL